MSFIVRVIDGNFHGIHEFEEFRNDERVGRSIGIVFLNLLGDSKAI
jgi:hypothetical protein